APAGRFAFESLPAGAWVLRVGNGFEAPLLVRTLTVRDGDVLDLGDLALAPRVAPQLRCTAPDNAPVLLQQMAEGAPATSIVWASGSAGVGALPQAGPGRYCLRLLDEAGNPTGEPVAFTLRADGACEPATAHLER